MSEEVAELLDRAHDELLVRGWCRNWLFDEQGRLCGAGAVAHVRNLRDAAGDLVYPSVSGDPLAVAAMEALVDAIKPDRLVRMFPHADLTFAIWQDDDERLFDDVLDAFRVASKNERERAS